MQCWVTGTLWESIFWSGILFNVHLQWNTVEAFSWHWKSLLYAKHKLHWNHEKSERRNTCPSCLFYVHFCANLITLSVCSCFSGRRYQRRPCVIDNNFRLIFSGLPFRFISIHQYYIRKLLLRFRSPLVLFPPPQRGTKHLHSEHMASYFGRYHDAYYVKKK